jgi:hypothetical protein
MEYFEWPQLGRRAVARLPWFLGPDRGRYVKLGLVAPMSGPNARYGAFSLRGAQLAAKEINSAGGVPTRHANAAPPVCTENPIRACLSEESAKLPR